jgi:hypothetical protein
LFTLISNSLFTFMAPTAPAYRASGDSRWRRAKEKPRLPAGPSFLSHLWELAIPVGVLALPVRVLLLLAGLLAAALLLPGFLTRSLVLLTRILLTRILILVAHSGSPLLNEAWVNQRALLWFRGNSGSAVIVARQSLGANVSAEPRL